MGVPGYLLDSNHVTALFERNVRVIAKLKSISINQVRACVITLGEIEAGHKMTTTTNQDKRNEYTRFVSETFLPNVIKVSENTRLCYAEILGEIWKMNPPPHKKKTERHLVDLGVDINDVWIAAVAMEHGLTLVTTDKMDCIRRATGGKLSFDNWVSDLPATPSAPS